MRRFDRPQIDVATRRDRWSSIVAAGMYSAALSAASVALPLRALDAGYNPSQVGLLVALTAVAQLTSRIGMGAWLRRLPDWTFIAAATALLATSCFLTVASTAWLPFVLAHLLQGTSRAFFWTGSQTHVVRGERSAIKALASVNLASSTGQLLGPLAAGAIGLHSLSLALAVAGAVALSGAVPASLLDRLPVFTRPASAPAGRIWRRPGVDAGCWAGVAAGAWRGLLGSYVPLALSQAGQTTAAIGALVGIANFTQILGQGVVRSLRHGGFARAFAAGVTATGLGIAIVGLAAGNLIAATAALALSGLGSGILQTLGPAIASDAVDPQERGQAIAAAGTFRAGALFLAPLGASAIVLTAPISVALALGGAAILWPLSYTLRLAAHLR